MEYAIATVRFPFVGSEGKKRWADGKEDEELDQLVRAGWRIAATENLTMLARIEPVTVLLVREKPD